MAPPYNRPKSSTTRESRSSIPRPRVSLTHTNAGSSSLNRRAASSRKLPLSTPSTSRSCRTQSIFHEEDPRPLYDKAYIKKRINKLLQVLSDLRYPTKLNYRMLNPPNNKEFEKIFTFLVQIILGNPKWKIIGAPKDAISNEIAILKYPFNISKSYLNNVVTMNAWPNVLGLLTWLVELLEISTTDVTWEELYAGEDELKLQSQYHVECYLKFMGGHDGPYPEVNEKFKKFMEPVHETCDKENAELKMRNKQLLEQYQEKHKEKEVKMKLAEELQEQKVNIQRINAYILQMDDYLKKKQESKDGLEQNLIQLKEDIEKAKVNLMEVKSTVSVQELSSADAQNLNRESRQISEMLESVTERCKTLLDNKYATEMKFTKLVQNMDTITTSYNDLTKKILSESQELDDANRIKAIDSLPPDDVYLVAGFKGTATNFQKGNVTLMPYFTSVMDELLKKTSSLNEKIRNMRKRIAQDEELIADLTLEDEQLTQTYNKLQQNLELQRQEQKELEVQRKTETDEKMAQLNMLKSCLQPRDIKEYESLKKELTAKLKAQTLKMQEEQAQMVADYRAMSEGHTKCKKQVHDYLVKVRSRSDAILDKYTKKCKKLQLEIGEINYTKSIKEMKDLQHSISVQVKSMDVENQDKETNESVDMENQDKDTNEGEN